MITTKPTGWTDLGFVSCGRCYGEDATSVTVSYYLDVPGRTMSMQPDRRLIVENNGDVVADADRDRALTAFDMVGADEIDTTPSRRVFFVAGS